MAIASFEGEHHSHGKFRVDRLAQRLMLNDATQGPVIIPKNELSNAQSLMEINLSSSLRSSTPPLPGQTNGLHVPPNVEVYLSDDELSLHSSGSGGGGRRRRTANGSPRHRGDAGGGVHRQQQHSPHHHHEPHPDDDHSPMGPRGHRQHHGGRGGGASMSPRVDGGPDHHKQHHVVHSHVHHRGQHDVSPHHAVHHDERNHHVSSRGGGYHDHHHYSHHTPRSGGDYDSPHHHTDSRGRDREYFVNNGGQPGSRHSSLGRRGRSRSPIDARSMLHHHSANVRRGQPPVGHHQDRNGGPMHHGNSRMSSMESDHSYPASGRSRSPHKHHGASHNERHPMHNQRLMRGPHPHQQQRYDHSPSPRNTGGHHGQQPPPMVDERSFGDGRHSPPPPHLNVGDEYDERGRRFVRRTMRSRSYRSRSPLPRENTHNSSSGLNLHSLTKAMFPNSPVAARHHNGATRGSISREHSPSPSVGTPHVHRADSSGNGKTRGHGGSMYRVATPTHPSAMAVGGDSPSPSSPRHSSHDDGADAGGRLSPPPSRDYSGHDISPSASPSPMHTSANGGNNGDMSDHMSRGRSHYQQHHGSTLHSPHPHRPVTRSPLSPSQSPSPRHLRVNVAKNDTSRPIIGEIHSPRSGSPNAPSPIPLANGVGADSGAIAGPGSPVDTHHRPMTRNMTAASGASSPSASTANSSAASNGGKSTPTPSSSPATNNGGGSASGDGSGANGVHHAHRCHCGKTFPKRHNLITHQATHLKKKPHRCELCNKHFSRKGNMQRHIIALHFGEKPYECEYCKKKFNDSSNMRKHIKNQHLMKLDYDGMPQTPTSSASSPSTPNASSGSNGFRTRGGGNGRPVIGSALPPIGFSMPPIMGAGLPPPSVLPLLPMGGSTDPANDKFTPRRSMRVLRSNLAEAAANAATAPGLPMPLPLGSPAAPLPFPGCSTGWLSQPSTSSTMFPQLPGALPFSSPGGLPGFPGPNGVSRAPLNPNLPLPNPTLSPFPSPFGLSGNKSTSGGTSESRSGVDTNSDVPMPLPLSTPTKAPLKTNPLNGSLANQGASPAPLISALLNPPLPFATNFQMPNPTSAASATTSNSASAPTSSSVTNKSASASSASADDSNATSAPTMAKAATTEVAASA